jgi:thymidylate synthase ThyX
MIKSEIIQDSINTHGNRLTTFILEFPRWILAEINTHRMFSRNVASSRAIPIEKMIEMIKANPAMPEFWGKNQPGMQSNIELDEKSKKIAKLAWLDARDRAIHSAEELLSIGLHKQYVNRMIENFMYVRAIVSATEFENFFALRVHKDAQPELQFLANLMLEQYNKSEPKKLKTGEWHIPFGNGIDDSKLKSLILKLNKLQIFDSYWLENESVEAKKKIAVARCARVSYFNYEGKDDYEADIKLCDRLFGNIPRHLSPTEHVAQAMDSSDFIGNYRGFKQYRKFFEDENLKDERVVRK